MSIDLSKLSNEELEALKLEFSARGLLKTETSAGFSPAPAFKGKAMVEFANGVNRPKGFSVDAAASLVNFVLTKVEANEEQRSKWSSYFGPIVTRARQEVGNEQKGSVAPPRLVTQQK